jgi:hypothetical protein
MKNLSPFALIIAFLCLLPLASGGPVETTATNTTAASSSDDYVPLDIFNIDSGYVFESDLNHGGSRGKQDEIQNQIEYGHRIHLTGDYYVHLGLSYDRFDFGSTDSPVPNHLQAIAGVFGIDVMKGSDVGAFISFRPGFYTQNDIGINSFDVPISLGRIFIVKDKELYIFLGAYASFLRGGFPVWPLGGLIWIPSKKVRLMGTLPDPKLIYSVNDKLDLYLGGELVGGFYRTDRNPGIEPAKLNGAQVDFVDYRAGIGFSYALNKLSTLDVGAGYSIEREFNFDRAGETYRTDPSPYVRVSLKLAF